jgi:hypothetical protein
MTHKNEIKTEVRGTVNCSLKVKSTYVKGQNTWKDLAVELGRIYGRRILTLRG